MYLPEPSMPEEGQFICIWTYSNKIWSNTFLATKDGEHTSLLIYDDQTGDFLHLDKDSIEHHPMNHVNTNPEFFILVGDNDYDDDEETL